MLMMVVIEAVDLRVMRLLTMGVQKVMMTVRALSQKVQKVMGWLMQWEARRWRRSVALMSAVAMTGGGVTLNDPAKKLFQVVRKDWWWMSFR